MHRVFATGFAIRTAWIGTATGALWTVVNERDEIGNDLVPDYMTSVQDGAFYGWPYYYYGDHRDERIESRPVCVAAAITPDYALGSHTASLGLHSQRRTLARAYRGGAFIGQHGSWNRAAQGYKVIFVPFANGRPNGPPEDVLTGFLEEETKRTAVRWQSRVAGGALLVADDVGNVIWRVSAGHRTRRNAAPPRAGTPVESLDSAPDRIIAANGRSLGLARSPVITASVRPMVGSERGTRWAIWSGGRPARATVCVGALAGGPRRDRELSASPARRWRRIAPRPPATCVVPEGSEVRYRVREQLAGLSFPNDAVGATSAVEGAIVFDAQGRLVPAIRASRSTCAPSGATRRAATTTFGGTPSRRTATRWSRSCRPRRARLPFPLSGSGSVPFELVGDLTVKDVTRRVSWDATASFDGPRVAVRARTAFRFGDFGLRVPRVSVVLSVEDDIKLEADLVLRRGT